MEQQLNWTKGLFESSYQIFEHGNIKHTLFFNSWQNEARAIGQESTYFFKSNGLFNPTTQLFDDKNNFIGTISYDSWHTKAILALTNGDQYTWNFTNSWYSKWTITDLKDKRVSFDADLSTGTILANTNDEVMLLAGLYIREHYNRILYFVLFMLFIVLFCGSHF